MITRRTLLKGLAASAAAAAVTVRITGDTAPGFGLAQVKAEGTSVPYDMAFQDKHWPRGRYTANRYLTDNDAWYIFTHRHPSLITSAHRGAA